MRAHKLACLLSLLALPSVSLAAKVLMNFEAAVSPSPAAPSTFQAAGPTQTFTVPGIASISGGVVLGLPTTFPGLVFSSAPNVYATARAPGITSDPSLLPILTLSINPLVIATEITGVLFNGRSVTDSYTINAYSGTTLVATQSFANLPSNSNSGHALFDLLAPSITSVTFSSSNPTTFDFLLDTIFITQTPRPPTTPVPLPLPTSASMAVAALAIATLLTRSRPAVN